MSAAIVEGVRYRVNDSESCDSFPSEQEARDWAHVMVLHDGSTVYADTAAEVLDELIPGYVVASDEEKTSARSRHAQGIAAIAQKLRLNRAESDGILNPADPNDAALKRICELDKSLELGLENPDEPGKPASWLPAFPLVLVTTSYAPFTATPAIGGNVEWIDPSDEAGYLRSLREIGVFDYWPR